jgi:hypothetical protein
VTGSFSPIADVSSVAIVNTGLSGSPTGASIARLQDGFALSPFIRDAEAHHRGRRTAQAARRDLSDARCASRSRPSVCYVRVIDDLRDSRGGPDCVSYRVTLGP